MAEFSKAEEVLLYIILTIAVVGVVVSLLLIISLAIPLYVKLKGNRNRTSSTTAAAGAPNTSIGRRITMLKGTYGMSIATRSSTGARREGRRSSSMPRQKQSFSPYNLYTIYLAIPDFLYSLLKIYSCSNLIEFGNTGNPITKAFRDACVAANVYLNCIVSYEVLTLLRKCNEVARYKPPSLRKITIQAIVVYTASFIYSISLYFIGNGVGDIKGHIHVIANSIIVFTIPFLYLLGICISIKYHKYLSSAPDRMKETMWYFLRIVFVFFLMWFPGFILQLVGRHVDNPIIEHVGSIFFALQPCLSTSMALLKSDIRNYVKDFVTCSYCFRRSPIAISSMQQQAEQ